MARQNDFGMAVKVWVEFKGSRQLFNKLCKNKAERVRVGENGRFEIQIEKIHWFAATPKVKAETKVYDAMENDHDGCHLESCQNFAPGSAERIAALREFYATQPDQQPIPGKTTRMTSKSAFVYTTEDNAKDLVRKFTYGEYDNDSGKHMHAVIKQIGQECFAE
jgi:hypothetical protein